MKPLWRWVIILLVIIIEFFVWTYPYESGVRPFSWDLWEKKPAIVNQEQQGPAEPSKPEPQQPSVVEPEPVEPAEPTEPEDQPQAGDAAG